MRIKTIRTRICAALALAALVLLTLLPPGIRTAHGQDNFFYIEETSRSGGDASSWGSGFSPAGSGTESGGSWDAFGFGGIGTENGGTWEGFGDGSTGTENGATWTGFEYGDPLPLGDGLLLLAAAGACYAALRARRRTKTQS